MTCCHIIQGRLHCGHRLMAEFWAVKGSCIPRSPWNMTQEGGFNLKSPWNLIMVKPIVVAFAAHSVSSCVLLRVFDAFCAALGGLFLLHRVGHWWCAICFWYSFSPGNSYWAEDLVWRWNAQGPSTYDRVERHRRPSLLYETGSLGCHETLGLIIWQQENMSNCWDL